MGPPPLLEIPLDDDLLKVLSSESRREIMRALLERRMTGTELATRLSLGKPAVSEHLKKLHECGLVERHDDPERRWVYFSLTQKGRDILEPKRTRFILMLGIAVAAMLVGVALGMALLGTLGDEGITFDGDSASTGHVEGADLIGNATFVVLHTADIDLENGTIDGAIVGVVDVWPPAVAPPEIVYVPAAEPTQDPATSEPAPQVQPEATQADPANTAQEPAEGTSEPTETSQAVPDAAPPAPTTYVDQNGFEQPFNADDFPTDLPRTNGTKYTLPGNSGPPATTPQDSVAPCLTAAADPSEIVPAVETQAASTAPFGNPLPTATVENATQLEPAASNEPSAPESSQCLDADPMPAGNTSTSAPTDSPDQEATPSTIPDLPEEPAVAPSTTIPAPTTPVVAPATSTADPDPAPQQSDTPLEEPATQPQTAAPDSEPSRASADQPETAPSEPVAAPEVSDSGTDDEAQVQPATPPTHPAGQSDQANRDGTQANRDDAVTVVQSEAPREAPAKGSNPVGLLAAMLGGVVLTILVLRFKQTKE